MSNLLYLLVVVQNLKSALQILKTTDKVMWVIYVALETQNKRTQLSMHLSSSIVSKYIFQLLSQ